VFKKFRNLLVGAIGAPLLRLLWLTLRVSVDDRSKFLSNEPREPVLYAFWHNRMLLMPPFQQSRIPHRPSICLISASSDGEMIARVVERFGIKSARGSSSRRGKEALWELTVHLENGNDVAITPDGPRGPRYQVHKGIVGLAQRTGAPIYPISYVAGWKIELGSWDGFIIPLPFARCRMLIGKPISIKRTRTEDEFEVERKRLEEALLKLGNDTVDRSEHLQVKNLNFQ
jgi:lysophospholipid acyltransferase (LPLAT)-like uncharacterized protein